jgi:hypothetical protein
LNADGSGIQSTFVALHNNLTTAITVEIFYFNNDGEETTPVLNTFILNGSTTLSFRPTVNDPINEGPGAEVPDKTGKRAGSLFVRWVGDPSDIQGRLAATDAAGNSFAYLLPQGVSN